MLQRELGAGSDFMARLVQVCGAAGAIVLLTGSLLPALAITPVRLAQATSPDRAPGDQTAGDVVVDTESKEPATTTPGGVTKGAARFTCQMMNGQYTVMYHPESQKGQSYQWANPSGLGGGWTAERRCNEISRRLEFYRPDGLQEMKTAMENGYNTVCVTTQKVPGCRIVLTVPPGQDPLATRDRVFQNLTVADSGQQTQAVNTYAPGNRGGRIVDQLGQALGGLSGLDQIGLGQGSPSAGAIDLRPFLDRADGGTGNFLRGGASNRPGLRLNPDKFR